MRCSIREENGGPVAVVSTRNGRGRIVDSLFAVAVCVIAIVPVTWVASQLIFKAALAAQASGLVKAAAAAAFIIVLSLMANLLRYGVIVFALEAVDGRWELCVEADQLVLRWRAFRFKRQWSRPIGEIAGVRMVGGGDRHGKWHGEVMHADPLTFGQRMKTEECRWLAGFIRHRLLNRHPAGIQSRDRVSGVCPRCGTQPHVADVAVQADAFECGGCGGVFRFASIVTPNEIKPASVPVGMPRGCRIDMNGDERAYSASVRRVGMILASFVMCSFWNGLTWMFALTAFGGLYRNLVGPLPAWYPLQYMQYGSSGGPSYTVSTMPLSEAIYMSLLCMPFMLVGAILLVGLVFSLLGRTRVSIQGNRGEVRTGLAMRGFLWTWKRTTFDTAAVEVVKLVPNKAAWAIEIVGDGDVRFGSRLPHASQEWLAGQLQAVLTPDGGRASHESVGTV